ncbi:MAG: DUF2007 domain-containing protein [Rhodothermales bacterium]
MHRVYSHFNPAMVQLVKNELEQRGIESTIKNEHLATVVGGAAGATDAWSELWVVDEERLGEAVEVVSEVIEGDTGESAEPWTCPSCGEEVDGLFAVCWNCGHKHPSAGSA